MKKLIGGLVLALASFTAYADESAQTNVWEYESVTSDFSDDTANASIVAEPAQSMRGKSQAILSISYRENDKDRTQPSALLILHNAVTASCIDVCVALINIDGNKEPFLEVESLGHYAYKFKESDRLVDLVKDAKVIKLGVELYPSDMAVYEFKPKTALNLNNLPSK